MICLQKSLSVHKNIIKYVDSSISAVNNGVHEVLLLMQYCKGKALLTPCLLSIQCALSTNLA